MDVHAHTLSRKRQCELLGVARSSSYYKPVTPTAAEQEAEANLARALQALQIPSKNGLRCIVQMI